MYRLLPRIVVPLLVLLLATGFAAGTLAQGDKDEPPDPNIPNPDSPNSISLPDAGSTNTSGNAWAITNHGTGRAGYFVLSNTASTAPALEVRTVSNGSAATGILGESRGQAGANSAGVRGRNYSTSANGYGVAGEHNGAGVGVYGTSALAGGKGVFGYSPAPNSYGGYFNNAATSGFGAAVYGVTSSPTGYAGHFVNNATSNTAPAVYATTSSPSGYAGYFFNLAGSGTGAAIAGFSHSPAGQAGHFIHSATSGTGSAVYGSSASPDGSGGSFANTGEGDAIVASSNGTGITIQAGDRGIDVTESYMGVRAVADDTAVQGLGRIGVAGNGSDYGLIGSSENIGLWSSGSDLAGLFSGDVDVVGSCCSAQILTSRVDHPLDSSMYLEQASILSPQQLGVYNGNATLDEKGTATITLPAWFGAMYSDFRYNLTPIGGFAPLYIEREIKDGSFVIAGGREGMKVSWQVSGVRADKYATENPLRVGSAKADYPALPPLPDPDKQ